MSEKPVKCYLCGQPLKTPREEHTQYDCGDYFLKQAMLIFGVTGVLARVLKEIRKWEDRP